MPRSYSVKRRNLSVCVIDRPIVILTFHGFRTGTLTLFFSPAALLACVARLFDLVRTRPSPPRQTAGSSNSTVVGGDDDDGEAGLLGLGSDFSDSVQHALEHRSTRGQNGQDMPSCRQRHRTSQFRCCSPNRCSRYLLKFRNTLEFKPSAVCHWRTKAR